MQLDIREVAALFQVSENTVHRWIRQDHMPAHQVREQYRFDRAELLEWATSRRIDTPYANLVEPARSAAEASALAQALRAGGIHYRVPATDKESALRSCLERMSLPADADRGFLLKVLMAREALGSTGIGDGVAIPHVRTPIVLPIAEPLICLCFMAAPVEFDAIDNRPVHSVFTLICPTVRVHLTILARLSYALRDAAFKQALIDRAEPETLFGILARIEASTRKPGPEPAAQEHP